MNTADMSDANDDLEFLLARSVAVILKSENPELFLHWFGNYAQPLAPNFFRQFGAHSEALRSFAAFFARYIWNRTALPGNHFRPLPLPNPERNAPCLCGSGRKYKQCCLRMEPSQDMFPNLSLLPYVLDNLTAKQRSALPYEYLSPEELEHVASGWLEKGRAADAAKLLEGLFADLGKVDHRAEAAFDRLLDCYDTLGNPLKKKRLLERGSAAPNKRIRAAAMQRRCCILSDKSDYAEAWALFQQLQRLDPNDPSLSHLEVTMLLGQGEQVRAAERARFWLARLARDRTQDYSLLMDFLREVAQGNTLSAKKTIAMESSSLLQRLTRLAEQLPAPACHYKLKPLDGSAGPLQASKSMQSLIAQWQAHGEFASSLEDDIAWLEQHPQAWQCFEIMADWLDALREERISHGFEEIVLLPVLRHVEALLRQILQRHQADNLPFEWGWLENRAALSLLQRYVIVLRMIKQTKEAVRVAAWMVLTLNPNDNQGMRGGLLHDYLRLGHLDEALALAQRYPDDLAEMTYGTVLVQFMRGQMALAQKTLVVARRRYPEVAKMLLAEKPRQPRLKEGFVTVGGKDEAWYYRDDHLDLWQTSGGLDWLRQQAAER
jgi:tetratricopeptide (TPR) repeat protein